MYWENTSGWDWLWGTFMMVFWVALLGVAVYIAVRLAQGDRHGKSRP
jgi:CubicO group peptidase (beta-lactamase class C family)